MAKGTVNTCVWSYNVYLTTKARVPTAFLNWVYILVLFLIFVPSMYSSCSVPSFKFSLSETFASEYVKLLHGVLCLNEQIGEKAILKAHLLKAYVYPHYYLNRNTYNR